MRSVFLALVGLVRTEFYDGNNNCIGKIAGTREATPENVKEAREQGYEGSDEDVCWKSLVDHELLHTIIFQQLYRQESRVLRHEAGLLDIPYLVRLWEEVLVLSVQYYCNRKSYPVPDVPLLLKNKMSHIVDQLIIERRAAGVE